MILKEFKAPEWPNCTDPSATKIFLAGTIDMGQSEDWQKQVVKRLDKDPDKYYVFNPRRDDFDPKAEQKFEDPYFYQQVNWELTNLDNCDIILMCLLGTSKSPISLLELGLYATTDKVILYCEDEFYRRGNLQVVCTKYKIPVFSSMKELLESSSFKSLLRLDA